MDGACLGEKTKDEKHFYAHLSKGRLGNVSVSD